MEIRRIVFRGKRIDTGEWLYGDLVHSKDKTRCGILVNDAETYDELVNDAETYDECEVDPDTVGQYTGMKDKDGKEIYEGDIIGGSNGSINGYEWPFKFLIKWNDERCGFNTPAWGYMDSTHYYNVIGNRWDNPELLEEGR